MLADGIDGMIDYRMTKPEHGRLLGEHVHKLGGLLSVNHDKPTIPWRWELPQVDLMEVWQSTWIEWNWITLGLYQHRLAAGLRISAIGGSDWHQPKELQPESPYVLARPTTVFYLQELSEAAILKAMKAGHAYITEDPKGPHLSITADGRPMGSVMRRAGEVVATVKGAAGDLLSWIDATGEVFNVSRQWLVALVYVPDIPVVRRFRQRIKSGKRAGQWRRFRKLTYRLAWRRTSTLLRGERFYFRGRGTDTVGVIDNATPYAEDRHNLDRPSPVDGKTRRARWRDKAREQGIPRARTIFRDTYKRGIEENL